ncbi:MAG: enoyl-CoA hydratase/isomerase family protein [Planctomycetes bacterium]|nr:enoyl-CoA hydratase/isomerase family protein [Planctomycetota bacterium]
MTAPDPAPGAVTLEELGGGLWRIVLDAPGEPVNTLAPPVLRALGDIVDRLSGRRARAVFIESGKPDAFVAGLDLRELRDLLHRPPHERAARSREVCAAGQGVFTRLEALPCPTIAVINGACLGGGMELALACKYRLATDGPKVSLGLPEVRLGLIPAWGGCQRFPRLLGLPVAAEAILSGRTWSGRSARRIGLVDDVVPHETAHDAALRFARGVLDGKRSPRRLPLSARLASAGPLRQVIFSKARSGVLSKTHGCYPAPLEAIEAMRAGLAGGMAAGLRREADAVARLLTGPEVGNLVRLFFVMQGEPASGAPAAPDAPEPRETRRIGVLGGGLMGAGIAAASTEKGIAVRLKDVNVAALAAGLSRVAGGLRKRVSRRSLTPLEASDRLHRIVPTSDWTGFGRLDLVVEAVPEILNLKRDVFAQAEAAAGSETILATNTSALSVDAIASGLAKPERFLGLHFFSPVERMPLVEIIPGSATAPWAVDAVCAYVRRLGKVPLVVKDRPGFLVNRVLGPYMQEACALAVEGAKITQVDRAMERFGMPMGPFRLMQEVGLGVAQHVARILRDAFPERMPGAPLLERMGKGEGFYRERRPNDPYLSRLLTSIRAEGRVAYRGAIPDAEIVERLVLVQVNEACHALSEGVVVSAAEVDAGMILGTGFAPFRGGLLRYADTLTAKRCHDRLAELASKHGARHHPSPYLADLAARGGRFYAE